MARLKVKYTEEVAPALFKKFGYKSTMQIPKIEKIVVNVGCGEARENPKVLGTVPSEAKVVVEGINMVTCHIKPRKQGEEGGIVKREAAIYASKVQVVCPKCDKGTRVAYKVTDGKKVRVCKKCGAEL